MPLGGFAGLEGDHLGVHLAPFFAEGVGEVVLVLDGYELHGRRCVHLDCFNLGRNSFDGYSVVGGGVDDLDGDCAVLPGEFAPVVVVEVFGERDAIGGLQVELGSGDGLEFAGGEDVVVAVDLGQL